MEEEGKGSCCLLHHKISFIKTIPISKSYFFLLLQEANLSSKLPLKKLRGPTPPSILPVLQSFLEVNPPGAHRDLGPQHPLEILGQSPSDLKNCCPPQTSLHFTPGSLLPLWVSFSFWFEFSQPLHYWTTLFL